MRSLTFADMKDLLVGSTILGCGGGGELAEGMKLIERAAAAGHAFTLVGLDELPDEALVVCPYGVGGLMVDVDDPRFADLPLVEEYPGLTAVRLLQEHLGRPFAAVISGELGGWSIADAFYPAAVLGLPVVDADPVGRAVPELQHSLFYVNHLPVAPQAVTNEYGDAAVITRVANDERAEVLLRALAVASRNCVWVADHPSRASDLRRAVVAGAVSRGLDIGRAYREALERGDDAAGAVARSGNGAVLFRGEISGCSWADSDGFTTGEFTVRGRREDTAADRPRSGAAAATPTATGSGAAETSSPSPRGDADAELRVWFKNENILSWLDGEPFVTVPDLVCVLDEESGVPLTNPNQREGLRVSVVGLPAADQWRSPRGIEVFGPRAFAAGFDYRPLEEIVPLK